MSKNVGGIWDPVSLPHQNDACERTKTSNSNLLILIVISALCATVTHRGWWMVVGWLVGWWGMVVGGGRIAEINTQYKQTLRY